MGAVRQPCRQALQVAFAFGHPPLAELHLEGRPTTVRRLHHGVHLKPTLLAVVEDFGVRRLGINPQIADHQGLEQQAQELEVGQQRRRRRAQRRNRQRRIDEVAYRRRAQRGAGAEVRRPSRQVLHDHQALQRVQVLGDGARLHGEVGIAHVGRQTSQAHRRGDVARQGLAEPTHPRRVSRLASHDGDVGALDVVQVASVGPHGGLLRAAQIGRPATRGDEFRHGGDGQVRLGRALRCPVEDRPQRDVASGASHLEQRHGPHVEPRETPGAGVTGDVVGGHRGAGENELAPCGALVHGAAHEVPDRRLQLPLIDEPWRRAGQQQRWIRGHQTAGVGVNVQQHMGGGCLHGGGRLAGGLGAFHKHGAGSLQQRDEFRVCNAGSVGLFWHLLRVA